MHVSKQDFIKNFLLVNQVALNISLLTDRNSSFDKRSSLDRMDGRMERKKSKSSSLDKDVKIRSRNSSGHEASPKHDLRPRSASGKVLTDEVSIPVNCIYHELLDRSPRASSVDPDQIASKDSKRAV